MHPARFVLLPRYAKYASVVGPPIRAPRPLVDTVSRPGHLDRRSRKKASSSASSLWPEPARPIHGAAASPRGPSTRPHLAARRARSSRRSTASARWTAISSRTAARVASSRLPTHGAERCRATVSVRDATLGRPSRRSAASTAPSASARAPVNLTPRAEISPGAPSPAWSRRRCPVQRPPASLRRGRGPVDQGNVVVHDPRKRKRRAAPARMRECRRRRVRILEPVPTIGRSPRGPGTGTAVRLTADREVAQDAAPEDEVPCPQQRDTRGGHATGAEHGVDAGTGGVDRHPRAHGQAFPAEAVPAGRPRDAPAGVARQRGGRDVVRHRRAVGGGGMQEREDQALAARDLRVGPQRAPGQAVRGEPRNAGAHLGGRQQPAPGNGVRIVEAAVAVPRQPIAGQQSDTQGLPSPEAVAVGGHEEAERAHQCRRDAEKRRPLAGRGAHRGDIGALQVAQPAVDRLEAVPARARAEVRRFDQRHPKPAQGGVPRDRGAAHASADDEQVVLPRGQGTEVALQSFPESAFTTRARRALSSSGICLNSKPTS